MLEDIDYVYPFNNAYFLSATKGCGNKCGFCAVQTLEPKFIPYIDIKDRIKAIDERFGPKKDLILMDNNVLRSPRSMILLMTSLLPVLEKERHTRILELERLFNDMLISTKDLMRYSLQKKKQNGLARLL
jgi:radical SAM superfamily enzyme YgiQ (UPF0313 family)